MSTYTKHIAECDYCGKTAEMYPINLHVPNTGYALPTGWFRKPYRDNIIICPDCAKTHITIDPTRPIKREVVKSQWLSTTVVECEHCQNLFRDKLMQCPWCGAEMTNGDTNYR